MKKLGNKDIILLLLLLFFFWRLFLHIPALVGINFLSRNPDYMSLNQWANMDGMHYLSIAEHSYFTNEQAFFPLYPLTINVLAKNSTFTFTSAAIVITTISFLLTLFFLWKLVAIDYSQDVALWSVLFLLSFPTSLFFTAVYTESMFLMFVLASFYFARTKHFWLSGLFGFLASATRFVGIFLFLALLIEIYYSQKKGSKLLSNLTSYIPAFLIPMGLLSFMVFLWEKYGDPLMFFHSLSAFGSARVGKGIILLPQILWRYIKILATVPIQSLTFWIALLEVTSLLLVACMLWRAFKKRLRLSYILFSLCALLLPTVSGTLTSLPRYVLACFVIFPAFALIKNQKIKYTLLGFFLLLQCILTSLFIQGYFVS